MKCKNCEISAFDEMLHRVNPVGQNAIWWCMPCIEENEPELAKNIKEDGAKLERALKDICLGQKSNYSKKSNSST